MEWVREGICAFVGRGLPQTAPEEKPEQPILEFQVWSKEIGGGGQEGVPREAQAAPPSSGY